MSDRYQDFKAANRIEDVVGAVVKLRRNGDKLKGICPFHSERTGSFVVHPGKQRFKCFGCGKAGDVVDFLRLHYPGAETDAEVMAKVGTAALMPITAPKVAKTLADMDGAVNVQPAPELSQIVHRKYGAPAMVFTYRDGEGRHLFTTCRFDTTEGKVILPRSYWRTEKGDKIWAWRGVPAPRPLYGLDHLAHLPKTATVLIVEGEKAADAAARELPHIAVVTWCGGTNNIDTADFTPLAGRKIILWPDADTTHEYKGIHHPRKGEVMDWHEQPGNAAMIAIAARLDSPKALKWVVSSADVECGWDAADAESSGIDLRDYVKCQMRDAREVIAEWSGRHPLGVEKKTPELPAPEINVPETTEDAPTSPPAPPVTNQPATVIRQVYYRALGYEITDGAKTNYWFFNYKKQSALKFPSGALPRESTLFEIAPAEYWEAYYGGKKGKNIDLSAACSNLMQECEAVGYFEQGDMRGRGAWHEQEGTVFNTGAAIISSTVVSSISDFSSAFAYTRGAELPIVGIAPLGDVLARDMATAFKLINFERITGRYMLAGWAVLAPFCGALAWRPHVWLNGEAGSGKSWIIQRIIRQMVGDAFCIPVQGSTTEAGVRQTLGSDALPVIFDEAEAENEAASARIKNILELARSASHSDGGRIVKGGMGGGAASSANAKSMFLFGSIVVTATQESDVSRITNVGIMTAKDSGRDARWQELQETVARLFAPENCAALRARTLKNLPTILKNIEVFKTVLRDMLGDQRAADQVGTLLAGAYSLHRNEEVTEVQARELAIKFDWSEDKRDKADTDADRLLSRIRETIVKLDLPRGSMSLSVGELIEVAGRQSNPDNEALQNYNVADHLGRIGVIVGEDGYLYISNTSLHVRQMLKGTAWATSWHRVLMRVPGATADNSRRFATVPSRCIGVPLEYLFNDAQYKAGEGGFIES